MSYKDGKNVPGSYSPYTVWLKSGNSVLGVDYRELNKYILKYNKKGLYKYVDFWNWLSYEMFDDSTCSIVSGFSALWNDKNINMTQVVMIKA